MTMDPLRHRKLLARITEVRRRSWTKFFLGASATIAIAVTAFLPHSRILLAIGGAAFFLVLWSFFSLLLNYFTIEKQTERFDEEERERDRRDKFLHGISG